MLRTKGDAEDPASDVPALVLDNRFEARGLQAFFRGLHGFLVGVRAHLHAVIFVGLRTLHKSRKFLFAKIVGNGGGVGIGAWRRAPWGKRNPWDRGGGYRGGGGRGVCGGRD